MNPDEINWWLAALLFGPPVFYYLQVARRKRDVIRYRLRSLVVYLVCVFLGVTILLRSGRSFQDALIFSVPAAIVAALLLVRRPPNQRRIPTKIRRAVIARDLKGERFDPRVHEVDHIVPFSRGGDHSEDNLRVISRSENRSRGAKMPKFRDFR